MHRQRQAGREAELRYAAETPRRRETPQDLLEAEAHRAATVVSPWRLAQGEEGRPPVAPSLKINRSALNDAQIQHRIRELLASGEQEEARGQGHRPAERLQERRDPYSQGRGC